MLELNDYCHSKRSRITSKISDNCWCSKENPRYIGVHIYFDKAIGMDTLWRIIICALRATPSKASHNFWTVALIFSMPYTKATLKNTQPILYYMSLLTMYWLGTYIEYFHTNLILVLDHFSHFHISLVLVIDTPPNSLIDSTVSPKGENNGRILN
jgi:hypothetical protein